MTSFVHVTFPQQHPGVDRAERAMVALKGLWGQARHGNLLLAALVSALLVVLDQVIDTWSEGHLLAAWIVMWVVAFAAMALFAQPARDLALGMRGSVARWRAALREAANDRRLWEVARIDPRVMSDLQCARDRSSGIQRAD
jgi:hypothetical protein